MGEKHLFALHTTQPIIQKSVPSVGGVLEIQDVTLWHRIVNVLHMAENDVVILFDGKKHLFLKLLSTTFSKKGSVEGVIHKIPKASLLTPEIHLYQGLVKKDAFEQIVYYAAQMGITSVTPVITKKIHRSKKNNKEAIRLKKIMITACEQAKQFVLPVIKEPTKIDLLSPLKMDQPNRCSVYFDCQGKPLWNLLSNLAINEFREIHVLIGPEGGLTSKEMALLNDFGMQCYALTPTVLRSREAVAVALGVIRSVAH